MKHENADGVVVQGIFFSAAIAALALQYRLPCFRFSVLRRQARSYGADVRDMFRRTAVLVQNSDATGDPTGRCATNEHQLRARGASSFSLVASLLRKAEGADLIRPAEAPRPPGEIIQERWAASSGIGRKGWPRGRCAARRKGRSPRQTL
jgi:hypothetical protein